MAASSLMVDSHILQEQADKHHEEVAIADFDPQIHLEFTPPTIRHSFTSLGLSKPATAPDMCVTEPFQLFSDEGVRMIRRDLLRREVLDRYMSSWDRAACFIGMHEKTTHWIRDMWYHPEVTKCISTAFGQPLKVLGRLGEVGYCNVQLGPDGIQGVYRLQETPSPALSSPPTTTTSDSDNLIDSWHRDSTQVVVVVMLSDTSTMLGGQTGIRTGDGSIIKVRGSRAGSAVVMQGCHTPHAAFPSTNAPERISMVTSYSFADPDLDDSGTSLRSINPQNHDVALTQRHFLLHKLGKLRERIEKAMEEVEKGGEEGGKKKMDRQDVEPWVREQITLLKQTSWEMFERYPKYLYRDVPEGILREYLADV